MDDRELLRGLQARDATALTALETIYGGYCHAVAYHILGSREDAEEIVNDALAAAWNAIPPAQPRSLRAYLGKLTRNLALKRVRFDAAQKRGGGESAAVYEELSECLPGGDTAESAAALLSGAGGDASKMPPDALAPFRLAVCLACFERALSGENRPPLILRDALAGFDERSRAASVRFLETAAQNRQILFFGGGA